MKSITLFPGTVRAGLLAPGGRRLRTGPVSQGVPAEGAEGERDPADTEPPKREPRGPPREEEAGESGEPAHPSALMSFVVHLRAAPRAPAPCPACGTGGWAGPSCCQRGPGSREPGFRSRDPGTAPAAPGRPEGARQ